ncbi:putative sterol carrier protein [Cytobacillus firmus]|uniref:Putative sterol carrier protein n=2 Tax=Cytobacillus TaxID=2675230 RepID=A0A366K2D5_CYTFI|nr:MULTISPECIES: SCP2 sterol-binding domain-containing protein [Cytobacillus]RBP95840.1 putative sterol carrier protein [Cytobacillus firmus]TDX44753.1 putative sterol carrier protein [Cytobacillus oceanisediminis]
MGLPVFSQEWAEQWKEEINKSEMFQKYGAKWEWPLVMKMNADPAIGLDKDRFVYVDLWHGVCREARIAQPADVDSVPYMISGDAEIWKKILDRKLDSIAALMTRKTKLERGNMMKLAKYTNASKYMVEAATRVASRFPEGIE